MNRIATSALSELTFRQSDTPSTQVQKLERLRQAVVDGTQGGGASSSKVLAVSITGGLPGAQGSLYRLRIPADQTMTINGLILGDAGKAATAVVSLPIWKDGQPNGSITFSGTEGSGFALDPNYPTGSLFEIRAPVVGDPTLDDVSLSIPVTFG